MEDRRNHDSRPDAHEREWMSMDPLSLLVKLVAMAGLAFVIGVSTTVMVAPENPSPVAATAH
jgi:hypothetical protein